jgi:hypothetical protein
MSGEDQFEMPVQAITLPSKSAPKYIILCEMPCKLVEARLKKKATNKGNDRVEVIGSHLWTKKKYEDTVGCRCNAHVTFQKYSIIAQFFTQN